MCTLSVQCDPGHCELFWPTSCFYRPLTMCPGPAGLATVPPPGQAACCLSVLSVWSIWNSPPRAASWLLLSTCLSVPMRPAQRGCAALLKYRTRIRSLLYPLYKNFPQHLSLWEIYHTRVLSFLLFLLFLFILLQLSQVFPLCLPLPSLPPTQAPHCCLCPRVIHTCSYTSPFPFFPLFPPSPLSLWQLSVCSTFPCLCFCFAH